MHHNFTSPEHAREYTFAGNATLTLSSERTGARYTFKVKAPKENRNNIRFLMLLTGPDNENSYTYLGMVQDDQVKMTKASKMTPDSLPIKAFSYYLQHLKTGQIAPKLEVRHEGSCGRCGRALTVPESIDRGIGPECAKHV